MCVCMCYIYCILPLCDPAQLASLAMVLNDTSKSQTILETFIASAFFRPACVCVLRAIVILNIPEVHASRTL